MRSAVPLHLHLSSLRLLGSSILFKESLHFWQNSLQLPQNVCILILHQPVCRIPHAQRLRPGVSGIDMIEARHTITSIGVFAPGSPGTMLGFSIVIRSSILRSHRFCLGREYFCHQNRTCWAQVKLFSQCVNCSSAANI